MTRAMTRSKLAGAALIAAVTLGLAAPALWAMGAGLAWILAVAERVAALPGALTAVVAPGSLVLPLLAGGALILLLWQGRLRWVGAVPLVAAFALWAGGARPAVLVSSTGGLVGVLGAEGRILSSPRGDGFAASLWLENDGDLADQGTAAARPGFSGPAGARRIRVDGATLVHVTGRSGATRAAEACRAADIVVTTAALDPAPPGPCLMLDADRLGRLGAAAITVEARGIGVTHAHAATAGRMWHAR